MKIIRINHIGIASKKAIECTNFFQNILGLTLGKNEFIDNQKVMVDLFSIENSSVEILSPTADTSPIAKFLETRGSGIHHIALEVDDIDAWIIELKRKNVKLIDDIPRNGAHNTKIIFIHPISTGGILVELVQPMH